VAPSNLEAAASKTNPHSLALSGRFSRQAASARGDWILFKRVCEKEEDCFFEKAPVASDASYNGPY
jgi:hypothetical protein